MTHPLITAIEEIRTSPFTTNSRLDDVPMRPMPQHQRQKLICQYMNTGNQVALINLVREQVQAEEYWSNRND